MSPFRNDEDETETNKTIDVQVIVIKQSGYSENLTALYIKMNPMMKFYSLVLSYLQAENENDRIVKQIVELAEKAKPSWETTEESLAFLECCVNRGSTVSDEEKFTTRNDFAKAAFRDLSVIKNPEAMALFDDIGNCCVPTFAAGEDLFIWARTVKQRPDGGGIIILHVSDIPRFRELIEQHDLADSSTTEETLEGGVQIGS